VLSLLKNTITGYLFVTAIRDTGYDILLERFFRIIDKYGPKEISLKRAVSEGPV